jgi:crossover junction endodeoxyribonuclease RuvC
MVMILGIDPGSRRTGFGVVNAVGNRLEYVASGTIHIDPDKALPERLAEIFSSLQQIINQYQPGEVAVENVFLSNNASSALKLGQARGAAITAAVSEQLPVYEYEARKVKQSLVGNGGADKGQVMHMVKTLLGLQGDPQEDASDALAVAICHANTQQHLIATAQAKGFRKGRLA